MRKRSILLSRRKERLLQRQTITLRKSPLKSRIKTTKTRSSEEANKLTQASKKKQDACFLGCV